MPAETLPTTAILNQEDEEVEQHAETHELGGTDPILPQIAFLGLAQNLNFVDVNSYNSYTALTDLTLEVNTNGGFLMIILSGDIRLISSDPNIARATIGLSVDNVIHDNTVGVEIQATANASLGQLAVNVPSSSFWFIELKPGKHRIGIEAFVRDSTANHLEFYETALTIFELLPVRRT